ncbi:protein trichome birefringence-like 19 [Mangifera indica]|uniref:protein trichome birefringence-like 19 n=1 Tax=Mangifera indica TaxID=29780 RepID=UPI001CFAAD0B|nr:protein trichome birefringence-like 19 [Mangifera indica]
MVHVFEFYPGRKLSNSTTIKVLLLSLIITLPPVIHLFFFSSSSTPWLNFNSYVDSIKEGRKCNMFRGKWIPSHQDPYYSNETCHEMHDQQNCMKFGRPDREFLKWRWKPDNCELPLFHARGFLEIVRGKSLAFVGDSLGRNQMESLFCLLSSVSNPEFVSHKTNKITSWLYRDYNFTMASFWAPHLVKTIDADPNGPKYNRLMKVYLDEADGSWATEIETFDYVIVSAGRWFYGPQIFYENDQVIGCHECGSDNIKKLSMFYGYRRVFRTTFSTLMSLERFKGLIVLNTLSPAHFENGQWNKGGNCNRTKPFLKKVMGLDGGDLEMYLTQIDELRIAEREGKKKGVKFRLLDATAAMLMRPDGHPNHYGHWPHENVTIADCVHWCMPGPVDTWNQFLLQMLRMYDS